MFRRNPSRVGRGRRAAVVLVAPCCSFRMLFFFLLERTRSTASTRHTCLVYVSTSNGAFFCILLLKLYPIDAHPPLGTRGVERGASPRGCSNSDTTLACVTSNWRPCRRQPQQTRVIRHAKPTTRTYRHIPSVLTQHTSYRM